MNTFVTAIFKNKNLQNRFEINKLGELRKIGKNKLYKLDYSNSYPKYSLDYYLNGKRYKAKVPVHLILAYTFLPNPNNLPIVDHIDQNKLNYSLSNLRFVSRSDNNINTSDHSHKTPYIVINSDGKSFSYHEASIKFSMSSIRKSYFNNIKYLNKYWKIINPEVEEYYKNKDISLEKWINLNDKIQLSSFGVLKINNLLSLGTICEGGYRGIKYNGSDGNKTRLIHRLVAKYFIGNIDEKIVDHIDGNRSNNVVTNLKIGTNKDNSNNPNTRSKLETKVQCFGLNGNLLDTFISIKEAHYKTKCSVGGICECCQGKKTKLKNFIFKYV